MDEKLKEKIYLDFTKKEADVITGFLNRNFSYNGQVVIASIFFRAKGKKTVAEVLQECEKQWKRNWYYQHPEIKGDPHAPGGACMQNKVSLDKIYEALDIPLPLKEQTKSISPNVMIIKTKNSTYRFGGADENGEREVSRDEKPLDFNRCKIRFLEIGEEMELQCIGASCPEWFTTSVISINEQ